MRPGALLFCVLAITSWLLVSGRRSSKPEAPSKLPSVGDALDIKGPSEFLGKNWQAVMVMSPLSANRRILRRDGNFTGVQRRRGVVTWLKQRDNYPWEKPWEDPSRAPFKMRFLRHDPAGIALSMAYEGKIDLDDREHDGRTVLSMTIAKPKPWWKRLFP